MPVPGKEGAAQPDGAPPKLVARWVQRDIGEETGHRRTTGSVTINMVRNFL